MRSEKPTDIGNAKLISEKSSCIVNFLPMMKFESIFDFYSEEPPTVSVQMVTDEKSVSYEQILRIRQWNFKKPCFSWNIYSTDREVLQKIVIRRVEWDISKDKEEIRANIRQSSNESIMKWPSIVVGNYYIDLSHYKEIEKALNDLDNEIKYGIVLKERDNPNWEWRDLEVQRLYDWGQVHNTWSTHMENTKVEKVLKDLIDVLDLYSRKIEENIQAINLHYSILPESYKRLILESNQ